jgi:transposase-like protein
MSRHRRPQEKLQIINEARTSGMPVSRVCRKYGISPSIFYEWEGRLKETGLSGLKRDASRQAAVRVAELEAEVARLKGVIAEIAEENLRIKKGQWP